MRPEGVLYFYTGGTETEPSSSQEFEQL